MEARTRQSTVFQLRSLPVRPVRRQPPHQQEKKTKQVKELNDEVMELKEEIAKNQAELREVQEKEGIEVKKTEPPQPPSQSVMDMDIEKFTELVPEMGPFQASLREGFQKSSDDMCLAIDGGHDHYGCAWMPGDRSNMTVKDRSLPMCNCGQWFISCWQPSADAFLEAYERGEIQVATDAAKAYLAGRCYISIYTWVAAGILLLFLSGSAHTWMQKRNKLEDPRLQGSSLDPNRAGS